MSVYEKLNELIAKHGLERIKDPILGSVKPSIEVRLGEKKERALATCSRFGGLPCLPSADLWPTVGGKRLGRALTFVGQIRLDDLRAIEGAALLPQGGLLSFFYDVESMPWGHDTSEQAAWRVLYFDNVSGLVPTPRPASAEMPLVLRVLNASFVPSLTVPALRSIEIEPLGEMTEDEFMRYWSLRDELSLLTADDANVPLHRLLGHPDAIQGCMQRTAQFATRDERLPEGVYNYYEHPRAKELIPGSFNWRLLLQVDSDDRLGGMWGDAGRIYYWIHKDDLATRKFANTWLFLQCH
ncbi:MAG: YwqG family protein [Tepidisphaeraceae bacterium]|jgi:uncharacterized protein YwqG